MAVAPAPRRGGRLLLLWLFVVIAPLVACSGSPEVDAPHEASTPAAAASERAGDGDYERLEVSAIADPVEVRDLLASIGATIEVESHGRIQALVPVDAVAEVHAASHLLRVERPGLWAPFSDPETLELMGADRWQAAGFSGHRVSVAILDSGFAGYEAALGSTLPTPPRLLTQSFRSDESLGSTDHGRRAAELVHRVAPGADLYLVNFSTVTEFSAAVDYLVEEQVDLVSFSLGYIHNGPGDGTGPVNEIVSRGVDAGLTWAVASGNWAQQQWSGPFVDLTGDAVHEFAPGQTRNGRFFQSGDLITVSLRWDDEWGGACSDYDIELFAPDGALVRSSRTIQDCTGDPVENLQVLATQSGVYEVRVIQALDDQPRRLDLMVVGTPDRGHPLEFFTPGGSLSQPADHPGVITVGAIGSQGTEASYSSRGPTADGRQKPDVLAPTGVGTGGTQGFAGTSAAAPHVAGALALFSEAFPGADRSTLTTVLRARGIVVQPAVNGTPGVRRVDTGTLQGLGPLLPPGGVDAIVLGDVPAEGGLALLAYRGPDGYPLRFAHRLVGGNDVAAAFRLLGAERRWLVHIAGAPEWVNTLSHLDDGDILIAQISAR